MAEILKITTPFVGKSNQAHPGRPVSDSTAPFELQDIPKVVRPATQEEILKQNNGLIERENSSNVLTSLLKDPAAAVGFLKNIFLLQEIVQLIPVNNTTVTQEIEQMFQSLLISPDDIAAEMMRQEETSTVFRGEVFTFLRGLLAQNPSPEMRVGVTGLLKAINGLIGSRDAMNAVSNSLKFLSESLAPTRGLSERLLSLSRQFAGKDAQEQFPALSRETLSLLKEVEGSLLYSPKLEKVAAITLYNLSRVNNNPEFLGDAAASLLFQLSAPQKKELAAGLRAFREQAGSLGPLEERSKIMDVLTNIIGRQASDSELSPSASEKIEKIIYSLLSSPCHFTPLLHFVVPVEYEMIRSFAEIWINPNGGEDRRDGEERPENGFHMLLVFDIQGLGQFEIELYTLQKKLELFIFCPPAYREVFAGAAGRFEQCLAKTAYQVKEIRVQALKRPRSLMDVFKSLPYKRTGVNVKI